MAKSLVSCFFDSRCILQVLKCIVLKTKMLYEFRGRRPSALRLTSAACVDRCEGHVTPAAGNVSGGRVAGALKSLSMGLVFTLLMWSVLLLYAEPVAFLVQVNTV